MIQQGIAYMAEIFEMYFQNVGYIILVCAVILLLLTRYRKKEVTHLLFVCGIILILFLNPVVIYLVCSLKGAVTGRMSEYSGFSHLLLELHMWVHSCWINANCG